MKYLAQLSKALTVGTVAALLLVASTSNQVALGAANVATGALPPFRQQSGTLAKEGIIAEVNGQYPGPILIGGFIIGSLNSSDSPTTPSYRATDFSTFD